jgi:hypothetical protein
MRAVKSSFFQSSLTKSAQSPSVTILSSKEWREGMSFRFIVIRKKVKNKADYFPNKACCK